MTPERLKVHAEEQQRRFGRPDAPVTLRVPGKWGKSNTKRLWPGGPTGRIVGVGDLGLILQIEADRAIAAVERIMRLEAKAVEEIQKARGTTCTRCGQTWPHHSDMEGPNLCQWCADAIAADLHAREEAVDRVVGKEAP